MTNIKLKSLVLAGVVVIALSAAALAKPSAPLQNTGKSTSQAPADTAKHKPAKHRVRNADLPYNSDAELYNAGSPANTMHERSGTLNPGRNFHSQGPTGTKKDTVSLQGRGTQ